MSEPKIKHEPKLKYKKMLKTIAEKHGSVQKYYSDKGKRAAGISKRSGFGSDIIGKDGLTGRERAARAGRKSGTKRSKFYVK